MPAHRLLLVLLVAISLFFVYTRTGLLPLISLATALLGFVLTARWRAHAFSISLALCFFIGVGWASTLYLVYSGWESGEVVDIQVGDAEFRTWFVADENAFGVIYESPPEHQRSLMEQKTAQLTFGGETKVVSLFAEPSNIDSDNFTRLYGLYEAKYGRQSSATNVYYLFIGLFIKPRRGSQLYLLWFHDSQ